MAIDPISATSQAAILNKAGVFGRSSGSGRNPENERAYVRDLILGQLDDPYLRDILTRPTDVNQLSTADQLERYGAISGADDINAADRSVGGFIRQLQGNQESLNQYAFDTFSELVGRNPTESEFVSMLPYFQGVNGRMTGAAYVSEFAQQEARSPEALARRAGEYSDDVSRLFGETLGRGADQDELDYYGRLLATEQITPYEVEQLLKNTNEFRTAEDTRFRSSLSDELRGYDTKFFNDAQESVLRRASRAGGGSSTSSALDFALTNLMGDIAERRGQYLAGVSAQQYGSNKDAARQDYLGTMDRYLRERDYERNTSDRERDYFRNRSDQNLDYMIQRSDYLNYLNSQRGNQSRYGQLAGGLGGAIFGGIAGGGNPAAINAGYNVGTGLGGGYDWLNR